MSSGRDALGHRLVEVAFEPDARAVDDAPAQPIVELEVVEDWPRARGRRDALEEAEQLGERVVVVACAGRR